MIKNQWMLITIDDSNFLESKSISKIFNLLLTIVEFNFVILTDIQGSGKDWVITNLKKQENRPIKMNYFLEILKNIKQFDWGDFYLFQQKPLKWINTEDILDYPKLISQSETTIRAVDNQYIYIYTPYQEIVEVIEENYTIESIKTDTLENLDYPY
jgi:hypothetical protein